MIFVPISAVKQRNLLLAKSSRAKSVCAMLNVGVKLGSLSRYAHLLSKLPKLFDHPDNQNQFQHIIFIGIEG